MPFDPEGYHRRSIRLKGYDYRTPGLYVVTICTQHRASLLGEVVDGTMHPSPAGTMVQTVWDELPWAYPGVDIDAFVVMPNHIHGIVFLLPDEMDRPVPPPGTTSVGATPRGCPSPPQSPSPAQGQAQGPAPTGGGAALPSVGDAHPVGATPRGCPSRLPANPISGNASNANGPAPNTPAHPIPNPRLSLPDVVHRFKTLSTTRYGDGVRNDGWPPYDGRLWQRNYYEHIVRNERDLDRFRRYIDENPIRWADDRHNPEHRG